MNATKRRDAELAQMTADPNYVPDWMNGGRVGHLHLDARDHVVERPALL